MTWLICSEELHTEKRNTMNSLNSRIAERLKDRNVEKKFVRTSALYRLAAALLLLRKQRGLTQKELAAKVGTTQTVISRLESASVKPSLETILKVAEALDAAVDIRLLPLEAMREAEKTDEIASHALRGIAYFSLEQPNIKEDAMWISSKNSPVGTPRLRVTVHPSPLRSKIKEYA